MHQMEKGMYYGYAAMALWGVLDVLARFAMVGLGSNAVVFTCYNLLLGGVVLVVLGGKGDLNWQTFKHPLTWLYGLFRMLLSISFTAAFIFITATEGSFMLRISSVLIMVLYWLLRRRHLTVADRVGILLFLVGFVWMVARLENGFMNLGVIFVCLAAIFDVLLNVVAEIHPLGNKSEGFRKRSQYTGMVLIVSSLFFLLLAGLSTQISFMVNDNSLVGEAVTTLAPSLADFVHWPTIALAAFVGFALRAPTMYLYLNAVKLIKADNILLVSAVGPFVALGFEGVASFIGILPMKTFDGWDLLAGLLMTTGAVLAVFVRLWRQQIADTPADWVNSELAEISSLEKKRAKRGEKITKIN